MSSPFNWRGQPSILADDTSARPSHRGTSQAQEATLLVERRKRASGGRNPGTIPGITRAERVTTIRPYWR